MKTGKILVLVICLLHSFYSRACPQATAPDPFESEDAFARLADSLLRAKAYSELTDRCGSPPYRTAATAIRAYIFYKTGNTHACDSMLYNWIKDHIAGRIPFGILVIPSWEYQKFLDSPVNRAKVHRFYRDAYSSIVPAPADTLAPLLLPLLMADQQLRGASGARYYPGAAVPDSGGTERFFSKENQRCGNAVYSFYRNVNRLVTADPGSWLSDFQFLLFAHDNNPDHRKLYLQLIEKAIADKKCPVEQKMNFLLRTEMMRMDIKQFRKLLPEMEEKMRKAYNRPGYRFNVF